MQNLASAIATKNSAQVKSVIIVIINRGECKKMRIGNEICPTFAEEVRIAREKGVIVTTFLPLRQLTEKKILIELFLWMHKRNLYLVETF